jgi:cell division protein ZapE
LRLKAAKPAFLTPISDGFAKGIGMTSIKAQYKRLVKSGEITRDEAQSHAVDVLCALEKRIHTSEAGWRKLFGLSQHVPGLYLWGPPGRGKSMLMDLFFNHVRVRTKRRVHFHAFMREVHGLVKQWRESDAKTRQKIFGTNKGDDPVTPIARLIARRSKLLCFDELQVTDIADAMILGRLFEALFANRVILIATSNRAPDALYKDGLNRDLFVPFIEMIKQRLVVHEVAGPKDFRLDRLKGQKVYFAPSSDMAEAKGFEALWADMTRLNTEMEATLVVNARELVFERAAGPLLRASFSQLCAEANGPADYLAIAERFTSVFIDHVPLLTPEKRNEARRFVTLVDALYEASTKVVVLAAAEPGMLYPAGDGAFEFERTVSRLEEMRSEVYLAKSVE